MSRRKKAEPKDILSKAIADAMSAGGKKRPPKVTMGFRADPELKAEAEETFGELLPKVLEAALRKALDEAKKR